MNGNNEIIETIILKFTNELKNQASLSYAGHKNLWVDLGWDLTHGDRDICQHVEDMLRLLVISLTEEINEILWLESWGGKAKINSIMAGLNPKNYDLSQERSPESEDILEDIVEYLKDKLFLAAEAAYIQNQEVDSTEEFDEDDNLAEDEYDEQDYDNYDE